MKTAIFAAVFATLTAPAFAGAVSDPIVEPNITPEMIEVDTAGSASHDWLVPAMAILMFGAGLAN